MYNIGRHPLQYLKNKMRGGNPYSQQNQYGQFQQWQQQKPQWQQQPAAPKPFNLKEDQESKGMGISIHQTQVKINPNLLHLLNDDEEATHDFLESLEDHERCIIDEHGGDLGTLRKIVMHVRRDIDGTAKDLEMDG